MRQHVVKCLLVSLLFILSGPTNASVLAKLQPRQDVPSHPKATSIKSQYTHSRKILGESSATGDADTYTDSSCAYSQDTLGPAFGNISVGSADSNYQNNQDCEWQLLTPPETIIEVTWQTFDLEDSFSCIWDYVEIQDLSCSDASLERYKYCGSRLPSVIISSSNMLVIRFHSDSSGTRPGFSLHYVSHPVLESASGNISVGSADSNYQNNQDQEWRLLTPPGTVVEVTWQTFDLEFSFQCIYDYVEIQDLSCSDVVLETYKYCGSSLPPAFTSSSNMLVFRFHSDSSLTKPGFSLHYTSYTALNAVSGNISIGSDDSNYQNNQDHEWRLLTLPGTVMEITWQTFEIEYSFQCIYDYVEMQDLSSPGVVVETYKYCGSRLPPVFTSSSNMLVIRFHSDSSVTKPGFSLHYTSYTVLESASGNISFGSADTNYQNNQDQEWRLLTPPGTVIGVTWQTFDLEFSFQCIYDYVEIQDLSSSGVLVEKYKYCGSSLPPAFTSSSNMLVIRFHSDSSMTKPGFSLHYNSYTGPSLPGTTVDWTSNLPSTLTTAQPPSSCNGLQVLETASGDIIVGSADTNYQNNLDCEWRLLTPPGTVVQVSWSTIDVESCGFSCVCDFVEIQDYSSSGVALEQYKYCGSRLPPVFTSSSNMLVIRFHSDSSRTRPGFSLHYVSHTAGWTSDLPFTMTTMPPPPSCSGLQVLESATGNVSVGTADTNYQNNLDCEWRLLTPPGTVVRVSWSTIDIESCGFSCVCDFVEIQDLSSSDLALEQYKYCGSRLPPVFTSSGNMLVIRFHSDSSKTRPGFSLHYVSHPAKMDAPFGSISVGSADSYYQNNQDCEWRLLTPPGTVVKIIWKSIDLEYSVLCSFDYVEIQNVSPLGLPLESHKYCGSSLPPAFTSSSNMLVIRFHSDSFVTRPGFSLFYISYPEVVAP